MIRTYYELAKPGMVYGNLFTTVASFLFAVRWHVALPLFSATVVGLGLVIASACVCNNIFDRAIDAQMERTKKRALVKGEVSVRSAGLFAVLLGLVGFGVLFVFVNILSGVAAVIGFIFYVALYTFIKRYSYLGALVGSVSGAIPIVVGYTAATNRFDLVTTLLFIVMACWQMAHFYAISLYRADEYKSAGVPVFAVRYGAHKTRKQIIGFIVATMVAMTGLWLFSELGSVYVLAMLGLTCWWLYKGVTLRPVDALWGRALFIASLKVLMGFSLMLVLSPFLP